MCQPKNAPDGDDAGVLPAADVVVGLGANLGETTQSLAAARAGLVAFPQTVLVRCSSLYRTAPMGHEDQPDFLNAVCWFKTRLAPATFAQALFALEEALGRVRTGIANGPRLIDLDLLYYEGVTLSTPDLKLPHPRLHERAFVLYPWVEVMPEFTVPGYGALTDLCRRVRGQRVLRLETVW